MTAPNYEGAWRSLSEPLSWMHDNERLKPYWGWKLADIANDLIDRAYPGLRTGVIPKTTEQTVATTHPDALVSGSLTGGVGR